MSYDPSSTEGVPEHGRERLAQMRGGFFTVRPVGERVPARQAGRLRPARARHRQLDLPHRLPAIELEAVTGDGRSHAGDVRRARAGDDPDGGGGRPARRGRRRRRAPRGRPLRVGRAPGRVHRDRHGGQAPRGRDAPRPERPPFTSDLSGQDFWTLLPAGYRPLGLVMGTCVYHVAHQGMSAGDAGRSGRTSRCRTSPRRSTTRGSWRWSACRTRPRSCKPKGIVGVRLQESSHGWGSHVIEFFAVGTAIVPLPGEHQLPAPTPTLSLNDGGSVRQRDASPNIEIAASKVDGRSDRRGSFRSPVLRR